MRAHRSVLANLAAILVIVMTSLGRATAAGPAGQPRSAPPAAQERPAAAPGFGAPFLVSDIAPGAAPAGSGPDHFVTLGTDLFFTAGRQDVGGEVFRATNAISPATVLKDIWPGSDSGAYNELVKHSGALYFAAADPAHGRELWTSNGAPGGTVLLADILSGTESSLPDHFIEYGGDLFFTAKSEGFGNELWKTDGTVTGTAMVKDIDAGIFDSSIDNIIEFDGKLFFGASGTGSGGIELYTSTGTLNTTALFKIINPVSVGAGSSSDPEEFTIAGTELFFAASNGTTNGRELWSTDGTVGGTIMVKDILTGPVSSSPSGLIALGTSVLFQANDGVTGNELWISDGTGPGSLRVADIYTGPLGSFPQNPINFAGKVYFSADDGVHGRELWRTDGTLTNTEMITDINPTGSSFPDYFAVHSGFLYFGANDGVHGSELWRTDGTITNRVTDLNPGAASANPQALTSLGPVLLFSADDGVHGRELWRTNGTLTVLAQNIAPDVASSQPADMTGAGANWVYFDVYSSTIGIEPYASNGTPAGTQLLGDINAGGSSYPDAMTGLGDGRLAFVLSDETLGDEPWLSAGTPATTLMMRDVYTGSGDSNPNLFFQLNDLILFDANDGVHGKELWASDGTPGSAFLVADIYTGTNGGFGDYGAVLDGQLLFDGEEGLHGRELWASDGTPGGTHLLADIWADADESSSPSYLTRAGSRVYFAATDSDDDTELWRTDGANTARAFDVDPTGSSRPHDLLASEHGLFFVALASAGGDQLWWTNGVTLTQVSNWSNDEFIRMDEAVTLGDTLLFNSCDLTDGCELWKAVPFVGLSQVTDIYPGIASSDPEYLTAVGGFVVFAATNAAGGRELWISDGTPGGTQPLGEVNAGPAHSNPQDLAVSGGYLYFSAYSAATGVELWALALSTDIRAGLAPAPATVPAFTAITYTVTITNAGPLDSAGVVVTATLSGAAYSVLSATPAQGDCTGSGPVICDLGPLQQGDTATVQVVVLATGTGTLTFQADARPVELDSALANNTRSAVTTVTPATKRLYLPLVFK